MDCKKTQELLYLYHAGETQSPTTEWVESHVRDCATCARENDVVQIALQAVPETPWHPRAYWESYTEKVLQRIEKKKLARPAFWAWVSAGALALLLAGTALYQYRALHPSANPEIILNLELLENLDVLESDVVSHEKEKA